MTDETNATANASLRLDAAAAAADGKSIHDEAVAMRSQLIHDVNHLRDDIQQIAGASPAALSEYIDALRGDLGWIADSFAGTGSAIASGSANIAAADSQTAQAVRASGQPS